MIAYPLFATVNRFRNRTDLFDDKEIYQEHHTSEM
jgi:hypothetical protein